MNIYKNLNDHELTKVLQRPQEELVTLEKTVGTILTQVKNEGDEALKKLTEKFDKVALNQLKVNPEEIEMACKSIEAELKNALQAAYRNIYRFHESQKSTVSIIETMPGIECWQKSVGIEKVGLYIPGGTAPLISTVLMLGIPATIAGCEEVVLCTPPQADGKINPAILYAANLCGIQRIFKVGGAQAIAAMAFGTESIPAVYKIFGPGNQYVTAAKQMVNRLGISIDMPAGPSEVLVLADESSRVNFVAADLLSQAEHGVDSQVVLVVFDENLVKNILIEIDQQVTQIPRAKIAQEALKNSPAIIVKDREHALSLINSYAPEHLILAIKDADVFAEKITNAGSVFIGNFTPESVGDYASGTNHTLPTNGFAKAYSGLNLDAFVKKITFQKLSQDGLKSIGPSVEILAEAEQLVAHKNAVSIRLKNL